MGDRGGLPVAEVVRRLEAGEPPGRIGTDLGLGPGELIASLAADALDGRPPALVREAPRRPWLGRSLGAEAWSPLLPRATRPARLALAAALLQIHDFWDDSHEAAQEADDLGERAVSAYWHAIAHRREPDPGNAAYWFRRVGRHPVFADLAAAARPLLDAHGDPALTGRLLPGGAWDPLAFVDLCGRARPGSPAEALALDLQRREMGLLLDATVSRLLTV